jgi:hypothetical protein
VPTLADWVDTCTASLAPLIELIRRHVLAAERIHGDDTTVPVLAEENHYRSALGLMSRDGRPRPAAGAILLFAQSRRRAPEPPPRRRCRDPPGATAVANSLSWPDCARRQLPSKRCTASTRSSRLSARSVAPRPSNGSSCARNGSSHSLVSSKGGCSPGGLTWSSQHLEG